MTVKVAGGEGRLRGVSSLRWLVSGAFNEARTRPSTDPPLPRRAALIVSLAITAALSGQAPAAFDVKAFGARGDGTTLDTDAINRAIAAAHASGGGTVRIPAGTYLSTSIHLQSNVGLFIDHGATILAADAGVAPYDEPEPNAWDKYQDFGHSHWHNALIWGDGIENVSITGFGLIHGKGLVRTNSNVPRGSTRRSTTASA